MNHLGVENIHLFNWASLYPSTLQSAHKGFGNGLLSGFVLSHIVCNGYTLP